MSKINILIVEDNVIIADDLQQIIESFGYNVPANVISYEKAVNALSEEKIDLVLIDINLATNKSGIQLAEYINTHFKIPFIFITSNIDKETIYDASKTKPAAYLTKPFERNTIFASIEIAISNFLKTESNIKTKNLEFLYLKKKELYYKVSINSIMYVKSDNIYLDIYCDNGLKFIVRNSLKKFYENLPSNFKHCSKSYIINLNKVKTFDLNNVFIDGTKIPISKSFKPFLKSLINS